MKRVSLLLIGLFTILVEPQGWSQDQSTPDWSFMPSILLVDHFPSGRLESIEYGSKFQYEYSGTGVGFTLRAFRSDLDWLAFTLNAGANWYESSTARGFVITASDQAQGVGTILRRKDFRTFPLMVGVEAVVPKSANHDVMFYLGVNAGMHFINGDLDIGQQTKFGYSIGGGFAVKILETGVRYYSFSDIRNIGVHVGIRLNSFSLN